MRLNEIFRYAFEQVQEGVVRTLGGLDEAALTWRADDEANTIAWLVWHLARVEDSHIAHLAGREQLWTTDGWAATLGLPEGYDGTGYGHTPAQVAEIQPPVDALLRYVDAVTAMVCEHIGSADDDDFDRVVDASYDPPVTAGVRCFSVLDDALQHVGQAAFVRGLWEREQQT